MKSLKPTSSLDIDMLSKLNCIYSFILQIEEISYCKQLFFSPNKLEIEMKIYCWVLTASLLF